MPLKIGGIEIKGPKTKLLVVPRDGFDIPFKFVAVTDETGFELLCPEPKIPNKIVPGKGSVPDPSNETYQSQLVERAAQREGWYVIQSLTPSNIEWETVKANDPKTWTNWRQDLRNAGFSVIEINQIYATFLETNMLTEDMLDEARSRFLASQQAE